MLDVKLAPEGERTYFQNELWNRFHGWDFADHIWPEEKYSPYPPPPRPVRPRIGQDTFQIFDHWGNFERFEVCPSLSEHGFASDQVFRLVAEPHRKVRFDQNGRSLRAAIHHAAQR